MNPINPAKRLQAVLQKSSRNILGLMSGMSVDGVDLAYAKISGSIPNLNVELLGNHYRPYGKAIKERLIHGQNCLVEEVAALNFLVGEEFSACVNEFLSANKIPITSVDAIGSHGQTLFHASSQKDKGPLTLQVGDPSIIAEKTGILTIGNFRIRDLVVGGQGAPLVALTDYLMYRDPNETVALNNLGSISNVTVVTPRVEDVLAFDTGPANMAADFFARLVPGNAEGIDKDGNISAQGKILPDLLNEFLRNPYFQTPPPKAAGYHEFGPPYLKDIAQRYGQHKSIDLVRTAVEFAAVTIRDAYRNVILPKYPQLKKVKFSGGGVYNRTLMGRIKELLPEIAIDIFNPKYADAKEALSFAVLANETLSGRSGNVLGATGAAKPVILGEIAL